MCKEKDVMLPYWEEIREGEYRVFSIDKEIYRGKTKFQSIDIIENRSRGKMLFLDGKRQSDQSDEFAYHDAMVHPALQRIRHPASILIIGGGEGATAREALRYNPSKIYQIDIDKEAVKIQQEHLDYVFKRRMEKVNLVIGDGYSFIKLTNGIKWDAILVDINEPTEDGEGGINRLYSKEFYINIINSLTEQGVVAFQIASAHPAETKKAIRILHNLKQVFNWVYPYFLTETQWVFAVCSKQPRELLKENEQYIETCGWYYQGIEPFKLPKYFLKAFEKEE